MSNMLNPKLDQPKILTIEEVQAALNELIGGEYTIQKQSSDELGNLYYLDVVVTDERLKGESQAEKIEYTYAREGAYPESQSEYTVIMRTEYYGGVPYAEELIKYIDGKWIVLN